MLCMCTVFERLRYEKNQTYGKYMIIPQYSQFLFRLTDLLVLL